LVTQQFNMEVERGGRRTAIPAEKPLVKERRAKVEDRQGILERVAEKRQKSISPEDA